MLRPGMWGPVSIISVIHAFLCKKRYEMETGMIRGIGTSKGIGIGRALLIRTSEVAVKIVRVKDTAAEKRRYAAAREQFIRETEQMIERLRLRLGGKDKTALVLKNQIYLIRDVEMNSGIENLIETEQLCAEAAIEETCSLYGKIFSGMDNETMNQRVADIEDMKTRLLGLLAGVQQPDLSHLEPGTVIVAEELHPSVTALMDTKNIVGIIAEKGGETSHAAILARALEIPAVLSVREACTRIKDKDSVIVDGEYGEVFVNPLPRTVQIYERKRTLFFEKMQELKKFVDKETVTADGHKVCLAANIGNDKEAAKAVGDGAEGVGLFRTEFLFMNGVAMPTEEEQTEAYRKAAVICKDRPLTIRTLDIGGDKDIPYMGLTKESNPFLGYRAIRFCLGRIDVFLTQLRAILKASAYGNIRIMIPLITSVDEVRAVKKLLQNIMQDFDRNEIAYDKEIKLGIMVETPAASLIADVLAREADFFSIGTNDLVQYTMAVDRGNENVAYLYSVLNPAVLRSVQRIIECAKSADIEVGMCGEAAANPLMIPLLLSFGLDEFSVTPSKVLETRKQIASWTVKEAAQVTQKVMRMCSEKEIYNYLSDYIASKNELEGKGQFPGREENNGTGI